MNRLIFLVDMNAFFISCETVRTPTLADVPAVVVGDPERRSGIVLTELCGTRLRRQNHYDHLSSHAPLPRLVLPDHAYYAVCSSGVMAVLDRYTPVIKQNSIDEAWLDLAGCLPVGAEPTGLARAIMEALKKETGLDCSIGISENKFLAKMAADLKKRVASPRSGQRKSSKSYGRCQ